MGFIVAIDGPAGSGKGTITKIIGEKYNLVTIDTGAMYRCVALDCLKNNVEYTDLKEIKKILKKIKIELKNENGETIVLLNGKNVSKEIRETKIDKVVAKFATVKEIRDKMTILERKMGEKQDVIMDGRDICTVVFPNADVKIYLDCSVEERANRRYKQNVEKGIECTYQEVLEQIKERNKLETEREIAPLKKADDAVLIDSTNMSIEEEINEISKIIEQKIKENKIAGETKITKENKTADEKETKVAPKSVKNNTSKKGIKAKIERAIVKGVIFVYCKIIYRTKIVGTENIPKDGAVIFCGNHRSFLDPPLIEVTCKRDDTRFLAKKELTQNKFLAYLGKIFEAILVNRDSKDVSALKESLKTLKSGRCIALFPEGTRNGLAKGEKAKDGVAYFALNSDAIVIPVGIKGGEKLFKKATITYGKPIDLQQYKANRKDKETMEKVTDIIMDNIIELTK